MKISKAALARAAEAVKRAARVNLWLDGRSCEEHIAEAAILAAIEPKSSVVLCHDFNLDTDFKAALVKLELEPTPMSKETP